MKSAEELWNKFGKKECISRLACWSRNHYKGSIRGAIALKEREIQSQLNQGEQHNDVELNKKERELENLLEDNEIYWKQRVREDWLEWGDNNTK